MSNPIDYNEVAHLVKGRALRLLTVRSRSKRELTDQLLAKGFDLKIVEEVVKRLSETGLVDDRRYSQERARSLGKSKGFGPRKIREDLLGRGISQELVEDAINQAYEGLTPAQSIRQTIKKRYGEQILTKELDGKTKGKLQRYLLSRGFELEQVEDFFSVG